MKEFIKKTVSMEINFFYKIQKHLITLFFVNSRKKGLFLALYYYNIILLRFNYIHLLCNKTNRTAQLKMSIHA